MTGVVLLLCDPGDGLYRLPAALEPAGLLGDHGRHADRRARCRLIGPYITQVMRGGTDLSAVTLARFFSVHIWFLPAIIVAMIGIHMYLIIRLGIAGVPGKED